MNAFPQMRRLVLPFLVFSFVTNMAVFISPLFMMQVLDRVVPSGNVATLMLLGLLAIGALVLQTITEAARSASLGRLSSWVESHGTELALSSSNNEAQNLVDRVAAFTSFLSSGAILSALNIPWVPLFCLALLFVHPSFLLLLLGLVSCAWCARFVTQHYVYADELAAQQVGHQERECLSNARAFESKTGMAMIANHIHHRFFKLLSRRHEHLEQRQTAQSVGEGVSGLLRSSGQILGLSLGAFLVATDQLSAGGMVAASIILAKSFATIEAAVGHLPTIKDAIQNYRYLCEQSVPPQTNGFDVGELKGELRVENIIVPRGAGAPPRLDRVSFKLDAGECLAIVGSSGTGKSTLLKAISGLEPAPIGSVFFDQSELRGLSDRDIYSVSGFLPQQATLLPGSIAENIAGFEPDFSDEKVVEAAKSAGVHGLISALPESYGTDLAREMYLLSAGQQQRIALARAIYKNPAYLFLDEPNALLDADGEKTLAQTLFRLKETGTTIIMILHRSGIMGLADKVLRLERGRMVDFGHRAEVLGRLGMGGRRVEFPVLESSIDDLRDWVGSQFTRSTDQEFAQKAQSVAAELFLFACQSEPKDAPRIASFFFTFIDDARCEISMVEDLPNEVETKVARVRAKLNEESGFVSDLPQDEASIATITRLSERFHVRSSEEATHFTVSLSDETGAQQVPLKWLI